MNFNLRQSAKITPGVALHGCGGRQFDIPVLLFRYGKSNFPIVETLMQMDHPA